MNLKRRSDIFLLGFITLSLLVHLLVFYLLPRQALLTPPPDKKPVYIDLRPPKPQSRELDVPVRPETEAPRETPAKRLGPADQVVKQETAPKGKDFEDMAPKAVTPAREQKPSVAIQPTRPAPPPTPAPKPAEVDPWRRPGSAGPLTPAQPTPTVVESTPPETRTPPSPEQLKSIDLMASAKSAAASITDVWRNKYRAEVEEGDTVWLDMEKDILISFFKRFRDNVYMVWNYPDLAKERGQEGTCLLKVTITRDGAVKGVELKESSGYWLLDDAAIRAIKKGAPYGPLPKTYLKEELNIMTFFQYEIARSRPLLY